MSVKLRFILLLGSLLGGLASTLWIVRSVESDTRESALRAERERKVQLFNWQIDAASRDLPRIASELAESKPLQTHVSDTPQSSHAVTGSLPADGRTLVWLLDARGRVSTSTAAPFPIEPDTAVKAARERSQLRFFAMGRDHLLEIVIRPLDAESGTQWVAVGRPWDDAHLKLLSELSEAKVSLRAADPHPGAISNTSRPVLVRDLADLDGKTLRVVQAEYNMAEAEELFRSQTRQTEIFIVFGVLLIAAVLLAVHIWVLRPLEQIGKSLAVNTRDPVVPLTGDKSEFGRMAKLVLTSFAQREALEHEVEERKRTEAALARSEFALREQIEHRAQLGRDLHDGVIQSLYAAGMGLAGIRSQLKPDQSEAAARLEQTRLALNETIHDVRNFIMGLEPEALKVQTFSSAVGALVEKMQGMGAFRSRRELDEDLAARLTLSQRVHALQIAREAISNALRHGKADEIQISLRQRDNQAEFTVSDNGRGFRADATQHIGHGLSNFAQRAQELGGELHVTSEPSQGTIVNLTFTLSI